MAGYMDIFRQDPLAPATTVADQPLPQMSRNAPPVQPKKDPTMFDQGMQVITDEAAREGFNMAKDYAKDEVIPQLSSMFAAGPAASSVPAAGAGLSGTGVDMALANAVAGAAPTAAMQGTGATAATTAGATGLAAVAPWLIGGYIGGKALGFFNEGGAVHANKGMGIAPLAAHHVKKNQMPGGMGILGLAQAYMQNGGPVNSHIGGMVNMSGPLSGIRYKSAGGEVVEAKFNSPLGG